MSIYYVYQYLRIDGTPYYIGKGQGNRAYSKLHNIHLPKDQTRIVMIEENMLETDAIAMEIELIAKYGRKDIGTGILRNLTNGGEGLSGYVWTAEARAKSSATVKKYWANPEARERHSAARKKYFEDPEARLKQSVAAKKRYEDPEEIVKASAATKKRWKDPEARTKMSNAMKERWKDPKVREKYRPWNFGKKASNETRCKISQAKKNISDETRKKMSESAKNKPPISNETRCKISEAEKVRWQKRRAQIGEQQ